MKKKPGTTPDATELRRRAEQRIKAAHTEVATSAAGDERTLLHELQVYQIELEMQNEELQRARAEMDALLARCTELYDFAPAGYFTLDRGGIILQANLAGATMLGVERSKLDKRCLGNYVDEKDRAVFSEFLSRVFAGQTRETCDLTLMCAGNTPCLVHIEANADETGQTCRAAVTDITEFRATQQQLTRQLRQIKNAKLEWESVFDSVLDPIFLHDKEFRILRCNQAYQQCAGIPFAQIIGQRYYEIFPKTGTPLPRCLHVMEKAEAEEEEEEEVAVGGTTYRSRSFSMQDEQGTHLYSVHILEDITEHKRTSEALSESETRFRNLVETTSDWIWEVDENTVFTYASPKIFDILGYEAVEIIGKTPFDLMPPEEAKRVAKLFGTIKAARKSFTNLENTNLHKDGHPVVLDTSGVPVIGPEGKFCGYRGIDRDITKRKRAEDQLAKSERHFRAVTESANDAIITGSCAGNIVDWNAAATRLFGYTETEINGQPLTMLMPECFRNLHKEGLTRVASGGVHHVIGKTAELAGLRKDGSEFPLELSLAQWQAADGQFFSAIIRDITERKQAEEKVIKEKEKFRMLFDAISDTVAIHDLNGRFLEVNRTACEHFGYSREELLQRNVADIDTPEFAARVADRIKILHEQGQLVTETEHIHRDGTVTPVELSARIIDYDGQPAVLSVARDITERKQAENTLRESEERYRSLFQSMLEGYAYCKMLFEHDTPLDFIYLNVNDAFEKITGLKDITGKKISEVIPGIRESNPELFEIYGRVALTGQPEKFESYVDALGIWFSVTAYSPHKEYFVAVFDDITKHKQAEAAIQHANRALATLSAVNRSLVRATDEDELLQAVCDAIVEQRGYRLAWVGYIQHDENKSIRIMAHAGHGEGYLDAMQLTWAEAERDMEPSGRAIRSGTTQLWQDIANDPQYLPWREEALQCGLASNIALPLKSWDSIVFGILHVYAGEVHAFTPTEIDLLEEMADDLAFGVRSLHIRRERDLAQKKIEQQLAQLQDNMEDTVRAIATIVEMRDPYTAGHQFRVADLAAAIAKQMRLTEEQMYAIHLAGTVHDLGKIQVPAEILSKPGKLSDIEYSLIKVHPQAGYDILKGIDFPWPIAQMVLQHHERMDGSGYPQGLKGEAILLGARILAVADVVEAISAHRPYRAGLGIEVALDEITKNSGKFYDPQAVDACLRLFREQGYRFA